MKTIKNKPKIKSGLDAPGVPMVYFLAGILFLGIGIFIRSWESLIFALLLIIGGLIYLHTSFSGKFIIWDKIIRSLNISKHAKILDLGCGHGAVLIKLAFKISSLGKAVGVDLWHKADQANNSLLAAKDNLKLANVENKTQLITADMAKLPLKNRSFDLVVSSFAFHNIHPRKKRARALGEAGRVLKPGGKLIIVDTGHSFRQYRKILEQQNLTKVKIIQAGFNGWWTGPWMSTSIIQAEKDTSKSF